MACAAEYGDGGTGAPTFSARNDPPVRRPGSPGNLGMQKALQVRCAVWPPGPG